MATAPPRRDDLPDPARPTVLFAGESIAFGYGLPYEETFPFLVGRDLLIQTGNLAVVGYGNDQAYLRVLDALERYRRPLAVVTLFTQLFVRQALPFVSVDLEAEDPLPGLLERHPGPRGARKIAAAVGRALSEELATEGTRSRPSR